MKQRLILTYYTIACSIGVFAWFIAIICSVVLSLIPGCVTWLFIGKNYGAELAAWLLDEKQFDALRALFKKSLFPIITGEETPINEEDGEK